MADIYLLPCSECNNQQRVAVTQAGSEIHCRCGKVMEVPTLRLLRELEKDETSTTPTSNWGIRQALIFLGLVVAIGGLTTTGFLLLFRPAFPYDVLNKVAENRIKIRNQNASRYSVQGYFAMWNEIKRTAKYIETETADQNYRDRIINNKRQLKEYHQQRLKEYDRYAWISGSLAIIGLLVCLGSFLFYQPQNQ